MKPIAQAKGGSEVMCPTKHFITCVVDRSYHCCCSVIVVAALFVVFCLTQLLLLVLLGVRTRLHGYARDKYIKSLPPLRHWLELSESLRVDRGQGLFQSLKPLDLNRCKVGVQGVEVLGVGYAQALRSHPAQSGPHAGLVGLGTCRVIHGLPTV